MLVIVMALDCFLCPFVGYATVANQKEIKPTDHLSPIQINASRRTVGEGTTAVELVELSRSCSWFRSSKVHSELFIHVPIKKPSGNLVFSKIVDGQGVSEGVILRSVSHAEVALEPALK